jgi:hypothetical protein
MRKNERRLGRVTAQAKQMDVAGRFVLVEQGIRPMTALERTKQITAEQRFNKLAKTWKSETELVSKVTKRILHPAYQKVIGMGEAAIPFILKDLAENGPDDWFWALTAITDENPITKEMAGNMAAMTEAWLQWGKNAGFLNDCREQPSEHSQT